MEGAGARREARWSSPKSRSRSCLLVGAGLLLRSLDQLLAVSPGIRPSACSRCRSSTPRAAIEPTPSVCSFYEQAVVAVRSVPGVTGAALTSQLPLSGDLDAYGYTFAAFPDRQPGEDGAAMRYSVTTDYFQVMGIPLQRGRLLDATDRADAPQSFLISESLASADLRRRGPHRTAGAFRSR